MALHACFSIAVRSVLHLLWSCMPILLSGTLGTCLEARVACLLAKPPTPTTPCLLHSLDVCTHTYGGLLLCPCGDKTNLLGMNGALGGAVTRRAGEKRAVRRKPRLKGAFRWLYYLLMGGAIAFFLFSPRFCGVGVLRRFENAPAERKTAAARRATDGGRTAVSPARGRGEGDLVAVCCR